MQCIIIVGEELLASIAMEQIRNYSSNGAFPSALCIILQVVICNIFIGCIAQNILDIGFICGKLFTSELSSCRRRTYAFAVALLVLVLVLLVVVVVG